MNAQSKNLFLVIGVGVAGRDNSGKPTNGEIPLAPTDGDTVDKRLPVTEGGDIVDERLLTIIDGDIVDKKRPITEGKNTVDKRSPAITSGDTANKRP